MMDPSCLAPSPWEVRLSTIANRAAEGQDHLIQTLNLGPFPFGHFVHSPYQWRFLSESLFKKGASLFLKPEAEGIDNKQGTCSIRVFRQLGIKHYSDMLILRVKQQNNKPTRTYLATGLLRKVKKELIALITRGASPVDTFCLSSLAGWRSMNEA